MRDHHNTRLTSHSISFLQSSQTISGSGFEFTGLDIWFNGI